MALHFLLVACANNDFDEAAFPPDQVSTELSFRRMANHGGLEPVLEVGQEIDGWQFLVSASGESAPAGDGPAYTSRSLRDLTGIDYRVTAATSSEAIEQMEVGTYGFASGSVHAVERDLAAGEMEVELRITSWTPREGR